MHWHFFQDMQHVEKILNDIQHVYTDVYVFVWPLNGKLIIVSRKLIQFENKPDRSTIAIG